MLIIHKILNNCVLSPLTLSLSIPDNHHHWNKNPSGRRLQLPFATVMWMFTVDAAGHVQPLLALYDRSPLSSNILQTCSAGRSFGQATRGSCRTRLWDLLTNALSTRALHVNTNGLWRVKHPVITVGNGTECIISRPPPMSLLSLGPLQPTQIEKEEWDDHERCSLWAIKHIM